MLPSKTRPKRVDFLASNGQSVRFLLKGGEDLQQEQRMQQLLACLNACVQSQQRSSTASARRRSRSNSGVASSGVDTGSAVGASSMSELQALVLNVTPLGPGMGVVQWVPRSVTFYDVFKGWQARMLQRYQAAGSAAPGSGAPSAPTQQQQPQPLQPQHQQQQQQQRQPQRRQQEQQQPAPVQSTPAPTQAPQGKQGKVSKKQKAAEDVAEAHRIAMEAAKAAVAAIETPAASAPAAPAADIATPAPLQQTPSSSAAPPAQGQAPDVVMMKPTELFYAALQAALRRGGFPAQLPRKQWPASVLLDTFRALLRQAPAQLLANEVFASACDAAHWWSMRRRYTASLALSSVSSYLLGIGDRHLNNMLMVQGTGQVVHIDSTVCFDQGAALRVPEVVPFRLTQMLVTAFGPLGAQVRSSIAAAHRNWVSIRMGRCLRRHAFTACVNDLALTDTQCRFWCRVHLRQMPARCCPRRGRAARL